MFFYLEHLMSKKCYAEINAKVSLKDKLVEINAKVDVNGAEVEVSMEFKNIGKTTLDEDFLESMLDKAA